MQDLIELEEIRDGWDYSKKQDEEDENGEEESQFSDSSLRFYYRGRRYSTHDNSGQDMDISDFQSVNEILSTAQVTKTQQQVIELSQSEEKKENTSSSKLMAWLMAFTFVVVVVGIATTVSLAQIKSMLYSLGGAYLLVDTRLHSPKLLKSFPPTYDVFVSNKLHGQRFMAEVETSNKSTIPVIPVFFDLQEAESDFILTTLAECFQRKKEVILADSKDTLKIDPSKIKGITSTSDFIYTNSLCATSKLLHDVDKKAKIYMIMYNPIVRSLMTFTARQDKSSRFFDERFIGLSFHQYLTFRKKNSLEVDNALTKAILCKEDSYEVNQEDYKVVRQYLDEYAVHNALKNYKKVFNAFIEDFPSTHIRDEKSGKMLDNVTKCLSHVFTEKSVAIDQLYSQHVGGHEFDRYVQENIHDGNEFDSMLYIDKHFGKNDLALKQKL